MPWSTTPTYILVEKTEYWDTRTDPDDDTKIEGQRHKVLVYEARGLTESTASSETSNAACGTNGTVTYSARAIQAGGWIVTKTVDIAVGDWTTMGTIS